MAHHFAGLFEELQDFAATTGAELPREIFGKDVEATIEAHAEERALENKLAEISRAETTDSYDGALTDDLYPFQQAGVEYVLEANGRAMIADQMGLGKTRQAIAAIETTDAHPAIVVCPASLKANWKREIEMLTDREVRIASGRVSSFEDVAATAKGAEYLIVNYDILKDWEQFLKGHRALVLDESHYAKNPKAQRTQAAIALAEKTPEDGLVLLLTGTPVLNRPNELITQLRILGRLMDVAPEPRKVRAGQTVEEAAEWSFKFRYCGPEQNGYGWTFDGASNTRELNDKLRRSCYVRRVKSDVLTELPEKADPIRVHLSLNGALAEYRKAEADFFAYLREAKDDEAVFKAQRAETLVRLNTLRTLAGKAKIGAAVEWVRNFIESNPGDSLVIFAAHIEVQHGLIEALEDLAPAYILGSQGDDSIEEQKARFQAGETPVLVASLKAAREGHTLHRAHNVVFVEQGWTPGEHQQAEDRTHRIGQTERVQPWYLLAEGTIDEVMRDMIDRKAAIVESTTEGGEDVESSSVQNAVIQHYAAQA